MPTNVLRNRRRKEICNEAHRTHDECERNRKAIREDMQWNTHTHTHVKLLIGRAKRAEAYPDELCYNIIVGLMEQMK